MGSDPPSNLLKLQNAELLNDRNKSAKAAALPNHLPPAAETLTPFDPMPSVPFPTVPPATTLETPLPMVPLATTPVPRVPLATTPAPTVPLATTPVPLATTPAPTVPPVTTPALTK